jgi:hypothetical protein
VESVANDMLAMVESYADYVAPETKPSQLDMLDMFAMTAVQNAYSMCSSVMERMFNALNKSRAEIASKYVFDDDDLGNLVDPDDASYKEQRRNEEIMNDAVSFLNGF